MIVRPQNILNAHSVVTTIYVSLGDVVKHFHVDRRIGEPCGNFVPYAVVEPWIVQSHVPVISQCRLNGHECL